jgi:hypothetical protein
LHSCLQIFRIPVNQWSLSTAALVGIFGISLLVLTMSYNHPVHHQRSNLLPGDSDFADREGAHD